MEDTKESPKVTFYSIGENCLGHGVLARHRITVAATPFSHARSNVEYLIQLLETNFSGLLEKTALRHEIRNNTKVVVNSNYSCSPGLYEASVSNEFEFSHHDVIDDVKARESYERKRDRFLNAFHGEGSACFVYHYRINKGQDIDAVTQKLAEFKRLCLERSNRPVMVCLFTQRLVRTEAERGVDFQKRHGIPLAILRTLKSWGGVDQDVFWGRTDDDLFGRMIGAFEYLASVEPWRPAEAPRRNLATLGGPLRLLRRLTRRPVAAE